MRVAIFHDYFSFIGGGEKLVLALARHLNADIITTNVDRDLISRMGFDDVRIISLGTLVECRAAKADTGHLEVRHLRFPRQV